MSNIEVMNREVINTEVNILNNDHRFFDPKSPAQPEEILGLDTDAVLRLGRSVTAFGVLPYKASMAVHTLPNAVRVFPLIEKMQTSEEPLRPEDVRPYRRPIKKLSSGVNTIDKLSAVPAAVGIVGLRRAVNRRIEREFPERAADAIEIARQNLNLVEKDIKFISDFENPKEQFEAELGQVAKTTRQSIIEQRDLRVAGKAEVVEATSPRGLLGFFTNVVRSVRSFFGFFSRKPEINKAITAYDAAGGIDKTIKSLMNDRESTRRRLPMLSGLVLDKLPLNKLPTRDQLAFLAPEILSSIFSTVPKNEKDDELIESVNRNPHEFRFITHFKKHYGGHSLESVQRGARTLLPAIRDVLPTDGSKVKEIFNQTKELLNKPRAEAVNNVLSSNEQTGNDLPTKKRRGLRYRLKVRKLLREARRTIDKK